MTNSGAGSTLRLTRWPGLKAAAVRLGTAAISAPAPSTSRCTRETGPRKLTEVTVALGTPPASRATDSGRTMAVPGPRRRSLDRGDPRPQHLGVTAAHRGRQPVAEAHELGDERRRGWRVELGGRRELLEATLVHHADPVGDGERLLLVVGDEQRRRADLELHAPDLVAQLHAHLGVERGQRLVEQQHRRLDRERAGQRDALLLAAGELVGVPSACSPSRPGRACLRRAAAAPRRPCRAA